MVRTFKGINPNAIRYPLDKLSAKSKIEMTVLKPVIHYIQEKLENNVYQKHLAELVLVNANQFKEINEITGEIRSVLDIDKEPAIFIGKSDIEEFQIFGIDQICMVLPPHLLTQLSKPELTALMAHELTHIKCDHMAPLATSQLLLGNSIQMLSDFIPLPGIKDALLQKQTSDLYVWTCRTKFSCDRAALLVLQDVSVVTSLLLKLDGFDSEQIKQIDMEQLVAQTRMYEDDYLSNKIKMTPNSNLVQPLIIQCIKEIVEWAGSEDYQKILSGNFEKFEF